MFAWIRQRVKAAVLAGVADAAEYLQQHQGSDTDDAEERLRLLLPAPTESDEKPTRRKGGVA